MPPETIVVLVTLGNSFDHELGDRSTQHVCLEGCLVLNTFTREWHMV